MLHVRERYCNNLGIASHRTEARGRQDADSAAATPVFQTVDVKRIRAAWMRLISSVLDTNNLLLLALVRCFCFSKFFPFHLSFFADTHCGAFALSAFTFAFRILVYLTPSGKTMRVAIENDDFFESEDNIFWNLTVGTSRVLTILCEKYNIL